MRGQNPGGKTLRCWGSEQQTVSDWFTTNVGADIGCKIDNRVKVPAAGWRCGNGGEADVAAEQRQIGRKNARKPGQDRGAKAAPTLPLFNHFLRRFLAGPLFAFVAPDWIRKSSRFFPALISAAIHLGIAPRPAQVSARFLGLRYFGGTFRPFILLTRPRPPTSAPSAASCCCNSSDLRLRKRPTSSRNCKSSSTDIEASLILAILGRSLRINKISICGVNLSGNPNGSGAGYTHLHPRHRNKVQRIVTMLMTVWPAREDLQSFSALWRFERGHPHRGRA